MDGKAIGGPLRAAKVQGLANIEGIVQDATEATPEVRREYLTKNLSYELGATEKQGIRRFQQYLREMGLVDGCHDLRYVG
jgi:predicted solute-binding protein